MTTAIADLRIESQTLPLNELRVECRKSDKKVQGRREQDRHTRVSLPDGRRLEVSDRFWSSFSSLYGLSRSVFDYFDHGEVFDRIRARRKDTVRITYEAQDGNRAGVDGKVLSCTNPTKPLLGLDQVQRLVDDHDGKSISYANGIVQATFDCPFPMAFQVVGDDFTTQFHMQMPLDGYGLPAAYLALLRLVCTNGIVGMSRAFKTSFQLGKDESDIYPVLERAVETFNNEEGFHSMRQRLEAAANSWASLHEASSLYSVLARGCTREGFDIKQRRDLVDRFDDLCGNPMRFYGLSALDELSPRKKRAIPVETTVYDLYSFASEASTHHFSSRINHIDVNGWVGETLANELDLEGTVTEFPEYRDYFMARTPEQTSGK